MKVVFHETDPQKSSELRSSLDAWGYEASSAESPEQVLAWVTKEEDAGLIILRWEPDSFDTPLLLKQLREKQHDSPSYIILIGRPDDYRTLLEILPQGAHELLIEPVDFDLLEAKLQIGANILADRQALMDSSEVLERYAVHIDRIAAERARQLFHAERLSTIGTMSAGLAHEINTPIGYISTSLETAKIYWEQTDARLEELADSLGEEGTVQVGRIRERLPKALERINLGLNKIDKLMSGLKNFARQSHGEQVPTSLNECIELALEMCESSLKYHVSIEKELQAELPQISVDPQHVEQVFINLLVNAGHALEGREKAKVSIRTESVGDFVTATVEDNGPGIPESIIESIWKPFYTTKEVGKGTGLGLAICKNLLKDNGGSIEVENKPDGGARFTISFRKVRSS